MRVTITETEAAEYIGISRSHLNNMRKAQKGPPYIQVGQRILYRTADIDTWLTEQTVHSPAKTEVAVEDEEVKAVPEETETVEASDLL